LDTQSFTSAATAAADPTVFLTGRPPMGEYIQYIRSQTMDGEQADVSGLASQWRASRDRIAQLTVTEAGIADKPGTSPVPEELAPLADAVLQDPVTKQTFGLMPPSIQVVELDNLVVFQKTVNLTYATQLQSLLGDDAGPEDVFHFAMPIDGRYDPTPNAAPIGAGPAGPLLWGLVSPSMDFRVLQTTMLDPAQINGLNANGRPTHVIAVTVGYGANLLSAMRVGSRLLLHNGSHRAYALRAAGHTHAPMLIQEIPAGEEDELLRPEVQQQKDLYLSHRRPPLLRDYFDGDLRVVAGGRRTAKQVRVQIGYEEGPALGV
jgi:hypothetical protein